MARYIGTIRSHLYYRRLCSDLAKIRVSSRRGRTAKYADGVARVMANPLYREDVGLLLSDEEVDKGALAEMLLAGDLHHSIVREGLARVLVACVDLDLLEPFEACERVQRARRLGVIGADVAVDCYAAICVAAVRGGMGASDMGRLLELASAEGANFGVIREMSQHGARHALHSVSAGAPETADLEEGGSEYGSDLRALGKVLQSHGVTPEHVPYVGGALRRGAENGCSRVFVCRAFRAAVGEIVWAFVVSKGGDEARRMMVGMFDCDRVDVADIGAAGGRFVGVCMPWVAPATRVSLLSPQGAVPASGGFVRVRSLFGAESLLDLTGAMHVWVSAYPRKDHRGTFDGVPKHAPRIYGDAWETGMLRV